MKNIIIIGKVNKISKLQKLITWYLSGSIRIYEEPRWVDSCTVFNKI